MKAFKWSERLIGRYLARNVFHRKSLVLCPNCNFTGYECDMLVVTQDLRIIDVEVKVSRADLRKDRVKDKWYHWWDMEIDGPYQPGGENKRRPREWPSKVWKHYYCMPASIWADCLVAEIPDVSGVLLMSEVNGQLVMRPVRHARPCRDAERLSPAAALDVARLANLRMWNAFDELDRAYDDFSRQRKLMGAQGA